MISSGFYSIIGADNYVSSCAIDNTDNSIFELAYDQVDNSGNGGLAFIYRGDVYGDIEVLPSVADIYEEGDVRADILWGRWWRKT